jgi:hypothetical protein
MPSIVAKAKRNFTARTRLEEAVARLSEQFGIERTTTFTGRKRGDAEFRQIVQIEEIAEFLEALEKKVSPIGIDAEGNGFTQSDLENATVKALSDEETKQITKRRTKQTEEN